MDKEYSYIIIVENMYSQRFERINDSYLKCFIVNDAYEQLSDSKGKIGS